MLNEERTLARETAALEDTMTSLERATPHLTLTIIAETEGRLRRETRRPIKYADYECYTLQSVADQLDKKKIQSLVDQ